MKLLVILFATFILALLGTALVQGKPDFVFSGNLGMAVLSYSPDCPILNSRKEWR